MARHSTSTDVFKNFALVAISSNLKPDTKAYRKAQGEFIVNEFDEYFGAYQATELAKTVFRSWD